MTYRRRAQAQYEQTRRTVKPQLKASVFAQRGTATRAFRSSIMDLSLFLAKFLSGKDNVAIIPGSRGYSAGIENVGARTVYNIRVPTWEDYNLPLDEESKYRIYRSGIWHEACHAKYTPREVYSYGATSPRKVHDPLKHDIINIVEDRRIEDLGSKYWRGYVQERLFSNGYAWSQRMDVGDFWKTYLDHQDPNTTLPDDSFIKRRLAEMRHEAFLQRLLVGKIKGGTELPSQEREKIEKIAEHVEDELSKIKPEKQDQVFEKLRRLTEKVIDDLDLTYWQPNVTKLGESSWDQTFQEGYSNKDQQQTRAGIDDYFDELLTVEVICEHCGKHYTKIYGMRGEEGRKFKEAVEAHGHEEGEDKE